MRVGRSPLRQLGAEQSVAVEEDRRQSEDHVVLPRHQILEVGARGGLAQVGRVLVARVDLLPVVGMFRVIADRDLRKKLTGGLLSQVIVTFA